MCQNHEKNLEAIYDICDRLYSDMCNNQNNDHSVLFSYLTELGKTLVGADRASFWKWDKRKNTLWTMSATGTGKIEIPDGTGLVGKAMREKRIVITNDAYSDPDFTAKLWLCGIRYMKGLSASRVYHFETKSTGRVKKNNGQMQFLMKWGMTSSTFRRLFTYRGQAFSPELVDNPVSGSRLTSNLLRGRLKALWYVIRGSFHPIIRR